MAQTTTNYGLLKPEATDNYNHLIYDNPNMDTIDATMKSNSDHAIDSATCIKTGTVHAVVRSNTDAVVFRFTATGDWNTGDSMTVDGSPVSVFLPNGSAAINGAYLINTEVIAAINGSRVTLMTNAADAADVYFDATGTTLTSNTVSGALGELNQATNVNYDASHTVKQMLDVTYGTQLTATTAHATVKYYINQMGNLIEVCFDIMPTTSIGMDNIDTCQLTLPRNPSHTISALPTFSQSASDRRPIANITVDTNGVLQISGAMYSGRQGYCNIVYM